MTEVHGPRKLKWIPEISPRARVVNDNPSPSVQTELIVFGCAILLVFLSVECFSMLGFH